MTTEHIESLDDLFSGLDTGKSNKSGRNPFKFLDPYGPEDRDLFFGRDLEIAALYTGLYRSPLLLIYGESGSGKTSLVQCGLQTEIPVEDAAFYTIRSAVNPLTALRECLLRDGGIAEDSLPVDSTEFLREISFVRSKTLVLFFDQFEEFFLFQPENRRREIAEEMASWLAAGIDIKIIISIREEYYARLSELEETLPGLYDNRFWVRKMSTVQAREVITGPCKTCGITISDQLVEHLTSELGSGGKGVELPILQVILDALYNRAAQKNDGEIQLSLDDYQSLGKIQAILGNFIEKRVKGFGHEEQQARQLLKGMITPEGSRRLCSLDEVCNRAAHYGPGLEPDHADTILDRLIDERIVRRDADTGLYELRHDALARTIHQWMTGMEQELMEVRQNIENRFREYQQRGVLLDAAGLAYITPYFDRLRLDPELARFIDKSRKEAGRKKRTLLISAFSVLTLVLLTVSWLAMVSHQNALKATKQERHAIKQQGIAEQQRQEAERQKSIAEQQKIKAEQELVEAEHNLGLALLQKAKTAFQARDGNRALLYARAALEKMKPNAEQKRRECQTILVNAVLTRPVYQVTGEGTPGIISCASLSPDGTLLVYGTGNNAIFFLDLITGEIVSRLMGHSAPISGLAFAPDGTKLAAKDLTNTIIVWEPTTGKRLLTLRDDSISPDSTLVISPGGKVIATGSTSGAVLRWELFTGNPLPPLTNHSREVYSVAFSPDGKTLASGGKDQTITLWNIVTDKPEKKLVGHSGIVDTIAFSHNGKYLASGSWDKKIIIWNLSTGQPVSFLKGHERPVFSVAFSEDDTKLVSGSSDGMLVLWDVASGDPIRILSGHRKAVLAAAFSPDTKTLASASYNDSIILWDLSTGSPFTRLVGHSGSVESVTLSSAKKILATGTEEHRVLLWDLASDRLLNMLRGHTDVVGNVSFSPDGRFLATASWDGTVILWDPDTGKQLRRLTSHSTKVTSLAWSHDGKYLASGSADNTIVVWDPDTGTAIQNIKKHSGRVTCVAFSPDDSVLASGSADNTVIFWDLALKKAVHTLAGHSIVTSIAFTSDGKTLAVGHGDARTVLWNMATMQQEKVLHGHSGMINSIAFAPDGTTLATGTAHNKVVLWYLSTGREIAALHGHKAVLAGLDRVNSVAFSTDGKMLASGAADGTVVLWDIPAVRERLDKTLSFWEDILNLQLIGLDATPPAPAAREKSSAVLLRWPASHPFHWLSAANPETWQERLRTTNRYSIKLNDTSLKGEIVNGSSVNIGNVPLENLKVETTIPDDGYISVFQGGEVDISSVDIDSETLDNSEVKTTKIGGKIHASPRSEATVGSVHLENSNVNGNTLTTCAIKVHANGKIHIPPESKVKLGSVHLQNSKVNTTTTNALSADSEISSRTRGIHTRGIEGIETFDEKDDPVRAKALLQLGIIAHRDGDLKRAWDLYYKALQAGNPEAAERLSALSKTKKMASDNKIH